MNKIKKGDSVIVIAGKDKGKKGEVVRLLDHNKCIVSAINMAKKTYKTKSKCWHWGRYYRKRDANRNL